MSDAAQQPDQTHWQLVIYDESGKAEVVPVTATSFTIGRELDNNVALDDLEVSRHHARLIQRGEQLLVEDLNSANGTLVNNAPLTGPRSLRNGDVLRLGSFKIKVETPALSTPIASAITRPHPVTKAKPSKSTWPWIIAGMLAALIIIVILAMLAAGWFVTVRRPAVAIQPTPEAVAPDAPVIELNQAPPNGSQMRINQSITVQAIASDPTGVVRVELWVNNRKVDQVSSSLSQNAPSMAAAFQWTPGSPGDYALEIRAYNRRGLVGALPVASITAIGDTPTPTAQPSHTPTPTITPLPPTATPTPLPSPTPVPPTATPATALLQVIVPALNVRSGPGTQYNRLGQLEQGQQAEIVGQASGAQGLWWQIRFNPAPDGLGWVSASPGFVTVLNAGPVPQVTPPPLPPTATPAPTTPPAATATATPAPTIISAPPGKTLLFISNRSTLNQPARLTLSGGKSVGGGQEFDPPPNGEIEVVLEPDFYRALWSSPARNGFTRGANFTAVAGKVMVMWIVPEEGRTDTEVYDQLVAGGQPAPTPTATPVPAPAVNGYVAPPGKALLVAANRSTQNLYGVVTISGGSFGGGRQITLDANTETPLELLPGNYRAIWNSPAKGGFNAGRDFTVSAGEVILSWIIPEDKQVFMQFPGQPAFQVNN